MKTLFVALILTASAFAQKMDTSLPHAKTTLGTEQCLADARLWREPKSVDSAIYSVLLGESDEMTACAKLSNDNAAEMFVYILTDDVLAVAERDRLQSFLLRHGNPMVFMDEDAEGKR